MASLKAEKPVGSSLFGQAKKEQPATATGAKTSTSTPKATASKPASKPAPKKAAPKKPAAKGGKSAAAKQ